MKASLEQYLENSAATMKSPAKKKLSSNMAVSRCGSVQRKIINKPQVNTMTKDSCEESVYPLSFSFE